MTDLPRIVPASDSSWLVVFDDATTAAAGASVLRLVEALARAPIAGTTDLHPAYASILVRFDPRRADGEAVRDALAGRLEGLAQIPIPAGGEHEIPVAYGGTDGPDLDEVARESGLSARETIALHAGADYVVRFLGFTPGFPYLSGLSPRLRAPRREVPRRVVPAGSVAIAGGQAGIYPLATPGGWRILGRTSLVLFDPRRDPPALLAPGDRVRFVPRSAP
jgi:KipI family sensor histidine kinase inhibitor